MRTHINSSMIDTIERNTIANGTVAIQRIRRNAEGQLSIRNICNRFIHTVKRVTLAAHAEHDDWSKSGLKKNSCKKLTPCINRFATKIVASPQPVWRLYSRYRALISIRSLTLHIPSVSFLLIQRSSFYTSGHLWLLHGSASLSDPSRVSPLKERSTRKRNEGLELTSLLAAQSPSSRRRTNYPPSLPAPSILSLTAFVPY